MPSFLWRMANVAFKWPPVLPYCGIYLGLARTVYMHRIWPYIWWFPCQKCRIYTVYIYVVMANPTCMIIIYDEIWSSYNFIMQTMLDVCRRVRCRWARGECIQDVLHRGPGMLEGWAELCLVFRILDQVCSMVELNRAWCIQTVLHCKPIALDD